MGQPTIEGVEVDRGARRIAALVFLQMLPATLLTPAIRPFFARFHAGNEHAMHAFMAVNMVGAALLVPVIGRYAERLRHPRRLVGALLVADAMLLAILVTPMAVGPRLLLRTLEGAAHVGATSLLLSEAAALKRASGRGHVMGMAGAALMLAVALGSAIGGQLVVSDVRYPFWFGAALQGGLALALPLVSAPTLPLRRARAAGLSWLRKQRPMLVPLGAVFVGRFTVGCLVVTFALFVHHAHGGSDRAVGMLLSLITLPFALAMYPIARLSDRLPAAAMVGFGGAAYAVCLQLIAFAPYTVLPLVMVAAGVTSACLFAPCLCYAAALGGERKEGAMALLNTAGCVGMLLGPMVAGITSAVLGADDPVAGYRAVFMLASGSVLLWLALSARWLMGRARDERGPVVAG